MSKHNHMQVLSAYRFEDYPNIFPMSLFNEEQAKKNHGQSLSRINERGGLTPSEMVANIERRNWTPMPAEEALKKVMQYMEDKQGNNVTVEPSTTESDENGFYDFVSKEFVRWRSGCWAFPLTAEQFKAWLESTKRRYVPEEKKKFHYVHDNSSGFHTWLDKKGIQYDRAEHFTGIPVELDIWNLAVEFAMYKHKAMGGCSPAVDKCSI
jgi:hypothetical protein